MQHLVWNRLFSNKACSIVGWGRKGQGEVFPLHDHDFPEVFWIPEGRVRHQINGETESLATGDLVFIRPADAHGFVGELPKGGTIANVALRADLIEDLRQRHLGSVSGGWWHEARQPIHIRLSASELRSLAISARELAADGEGTAATARFVLNLFHLLGQHDAPQRVQSEPAWLGEARLAMEHPKNLPFGVSRLVKLSNRSHEHLARTVRQVHGITPTELVNHQRLRWASEQLQFSAEPIAGIALDAGFESLSHFYKLFRQEFGVSPRHFRLRARSTV